jgi:hypothetical protein
VPFSINYACIGISGMLSVVITQMRGNRLLKSTQVLDNFVFGGSFRSSILAAAAEAASERVGGFAVTRLAMLVTVSVLSILTLK